MKRVGEKEFDVVVSGIEEGEFGPEKATEIVTVVANSPKNAIKRAVGVSNLISRSNSSTKSSVMFLMVLTTTPVSSASCVKVRSKQRLRTC